nr:MAG TPA: hypothetical protein [Caudoviricetes sp.]
MFRVELVWRHLHLHLYHTGPMLLQIFLKIHLSSFIFRFKN